MPYADPIKAREYNRLSNQRQRQLHPERHRAALSKWRSNPANKAKTKAYDQRPDVREKKWEQHIWKTHRCTAVDYFACLEAQRGHCALCGRTPDQERFGKLHVDHCHETGAIRGLLCMTHNQTLGKLGDNEAGLMRALEYVRHPWRA